VVAADELCRGCKYGIAMSRRQLRRYLPLNPAKHVTSFLVTAQRARDAIEPHHCKVAEHEADKVRV